MRERRILALSCSISCSTKQADTIRLKEDSGPVRRAFIRKDRVPNCVQMYQKGKNIKDLRLVTDPGLRDARNSPGWGREVGNRRSQLGVVG